MKKNNKYFALLGSSGYIAKKHVAVIKSIKKELILAYDPYNSSGYLDSFFPKCEFAKNEKNFFDIVKKRKISYVVICSPNYKHYNHIRKSLISGSDVICEKPTVMNLSQLKKIKKIEKIYNRSCFSIFQLRYNKNLLNLKTKILRNKKFNFFNLKYATYRGKWYQESWKNNQNLSGGLIMNIGVHFIDILTLLFGRILRFKLSKKNQNTLKGVIYFLNSKVNFLLSIEKKYLLKINQPIRNLSLNNIKVDLAKNFQDLHVECYKKILSGKGISIDDLLLTFKNLEIIQNEIKK